MRAVVSTVLAVFFVGLVFVITWKYFDLTRSPTPGTLEIPPLRQNVVEFSRVEALAFNPASNTVLVGTPEGVFSYDSLNGWSLKNAEYDFGALAAIGSGAYLASGHPAAQPLVNSGLLMSPDRGATWRTLNNINTDIRTLVTIPDTDVVIARPFSTTEGLLISPDGGRNFQKFDTQGLPQPTTSISGGSKAGQTLLLAGTLEGAYLSDTEGAFWQRITKLPQMLIVVVAVGPRNPSFMLVAGIDEVWVTSDAGTTWTKVVLTDIQDPHVNAAGYSFDNLPVLAVASGDGRLYISPDNGRAWTTIR